MKKILLLFIICVYSCSKYSSEVNKALEMAGENKEELIKVLTHYKNQGKNEKFRAAEFLISNLPYNYAFDTINLYKYRNVYNTFDSVSKYKKGFDLGWNMNVFWDSIKEKNNPYENIYSKKLIEDNKVILSGFLIEDIELAYSEWKRNPYTKDSVSFNHFCEYILPYRLVQGKAIENWRTFFKEQNKNYFIDKYPLPLLTSVDSLLYRYRDFKFNWGIMQGLPFLKFKDLLKVTEGKCSSKTWLNTMILASQGVPVVSDFVPAWANRNGSHEWNAIIYGGKTYPFESYWEEKDRWRYKKLYNNAETDKEEGKFRLPKVLRHSFSTHFEGPIGDKRVKFENIPAQFRNIKSIDVSSEYFKTADVTIELDEKKVEGSYYAYLCVMGEKQKWIPVHWGEIEKKSITFKDMGTDIVYLPVLYKNGRIIPINSPFHLDETGNRTHFNHTKETEIVNLTRKYPLLSPKLEDFALNLKGAKIQGANRSDFSDAFTISEIDFTPRLIPHDLYVSSNKKYKYIRIISDKEIELVKLQFWSINKNGGEVELKGIPIASDNLKKESLNNLFDKNYFSKNEFVKNINSPAWMGLNISVPQKISKVTFCPATQKNSVWKGLNYELFYWNKEAFKSLGRKKASSYNIEFDNVPKNALLSLKCLDEGTQERIYVYKNGKQIWY